MKFAILSIGLVAGLISCSPAIAQQGDYSPCLPGWKVVEREEMAEQLLGQYGEAPVAAMIEQLVQPGDVAGVTELFINPETGTWSIISTNVDMMSCFVQSGHQFFMTLPEGEVSGESL